MNNFLTNLKIFFEKLDNFRDRILFNFIIKKYWPKKFLPNHLTVIRIIIGLFLFVILFYYKSDNSLLIISLFLIGAITDLLDGSIARTLKKETKFGIIVDPIADRILIIPIVVYSLFYNHKLLFLFIIILEVINALISAWAQGKKVLIQPNIFGKIKMFLQSVAFAGILMFGLQKPQMFFIYILWLSVIFIVVSIFFKFIELKSLNVWQIKNI
mgnify:CR=1 FL=1